MAGDSLFWTFFGSVWLIVGLMMAVGSVVSLLTGFPPPSSPDLRWVFLPVGAAMTGAGGALVVAARRAVARARRMMAVGIEIDATVTEIRRSMIAINRQPRYRVRYRYAHGAAGALTGESGALRRAVIADLAPGARVRIKIDPVRPQDSLFLPPA